MPAHDHSPDGFADLINLTTLKRYRPLMAGTTLAAVVLAGIYIVVVEPVYESEVRVVIQHLGLGLDGTTGTKSYDKEFLSTQAEMIQSPLVVSRAIEILPPVERVEPGDNPVDDILEGLRVNLLANTDIVRVTYQHADAHHATDRLQSILQSYQSHLRTAEHTSATESYELLTTREIEVRQELDALQQQLAEVRTAARSGAAGSDAIGADRLLLRELTAQWAGVRARQAWAETAADAEIDSVHLDGFARETESPLARELRALRASLNAAQADLEETSRVYGPQHPERTSREQRVSVLSQQLTDLQSLREAEWELQRNQLAAEEQALRQLMESESRRLEDFDATQLAEERLVAEIERVSELHRSTLATLEAVGLADRALTEGRASIAVNVIDEYVVPPEPVWPRTVPLLGASALLGALSSLVVIVLLEARSLADGRSVVRMAGDAKSSPTGECAEAAVARTVRDLQNSVLTRPAVRSQPPVRFNEQEVHG